MKWEKVREQFPDRCVLVEALKAETKGKQRIIDEFSVISDFDNGNAAWKAYRSLHDEDPSRELYIFHTKNENITVFEQNYRK